MHDTARLRVPRNEAIRPRRHLILYFLDKLLAAMQNARKIKESMSLMRISTFGAMIVLFAFGLMQPAQAAEPQVRLSKNGISYMTGGIGHEEVLEMRPHAKKFTLNLLFSEGDAGQSVTAVNVNIYNEQSELIFRLKGSKPVLYVNLPAGTYTILATNDGEKLRHKLTIEGNTNQKVILNWKNEQLDLMNNETGE